MLMFKRRLAMLAVVGAACSDGSAEHVVDPTLQVSFPCVAEADDYRMPEGSFYSLDERYAELARATPGGFGGFFLVDGTATAYLVDLAQAENAERMLSEELGYGEVSFLQGRYDWLELISCYRTLLHGGVWATNVHGTDIQEALNRIVLTTSDLDRDEATVRALIRRLRVPQDMIVFVEEDPPSFDATVPR